MTSSCQPVFIVGCGRSGTQAVGRLFDSYKHVTMHHEYMIHYVQPLGVEYWMGRVDGEQVRASIDRLHGAAIRLSETPVWGDCSNKLAWFIDVLDEMYPEARFIHLVRDGRKATSSLYHKLGNECLDDRSVALLDDYFTSDDESRKPPPEKRYWWPTARPGDPFYDEYGAFSHLERIAYHWAQINREIIRQLGNVAPERQLRVRLEDITADRDQLANMLAFVGLETAAEQEELMVRPHNVIKPVNYMLDENQLRSFWRLAGEEMRLFGYSDQEEYTLDYNPAPTEKS